MFQHFYNRNACYKANYFFFHPQTILCLLWGHQVSFSSWGFWCSGWCDCKMYSHHDDPQVDVTLRCAVTMMTHRERRWDILHLCDFFLTTSIRPPSIFLSKRITWECFSRTIAVGIYEKLWWNSQYLQNRHFVYMFFEHFNVTKRWQTASIWGWFTLLSQPTE